jgi:Gpi18-like mannosyltransferase
MNVQTRTRPIDMSTLSRSDTIIGFALFPFTLLFLHFFRPLEMSPNSLWYINRVDKWSWSEPSFYPPHLIHTPTISLINSFLSETLSCDPLCSGVLHSMIWAAVAIVSVYFIARVTLKTIPAALSTALLVLVSHGFWVYATQAEVYAAVVGCTLAATALLFTNLSTALDGMRVVLVSAFWALATLYHSASILLLLPFAAYFWGSQGVRGWRQLITVCVLAGSIVLVTVIAAYAWAGDQSRGHEGWSVGDFFPGSSKSQIVP